MKGRGKENEEWLFDGREWRGEGRGEKELEKGEYLESDCEDCLIINPFMNVVCFELPLCTSIHCALTEFRGRKSRKFQRRIQRALGRT